MELITSEKKQIRGLTWSESGIDFERLSKCGQELVDRSGRSPILLFSSLDCLGLLGSCEAIGGGFQRIVIVCIGWCSNGRNYGWLSSGE